MSKNNKTLEKLTKGLDAAGLLALQEQLAELAREQAKREKEEALEKSARWAEKHRQAVYASSLPQDVKQALAQIWGDQLDARAHG